MWEKSHCGGDTFLFTGVCWNCGPICGVVLIPTKKVSKCQLSLFCVLLEYFTRNEIRKMYANVNRMWNDVLIAPGRLKSGPWTHTFSIVLLFLVEIFFIETKSILFSYSSYVYIFFINYYYYNINLNHRNYSIVIKYWNVCSI